MIKQEGEATAPHGQVLGNSKGFYPLTRTKAFTLVFHFWFLMRRSIHTLWWEDRVASMHTAVQAPL